MPIKLCRWRGVVNFGPGERKLAEAVRLAAEQGLFMVPAYHAQLVRGVASYGLELFDAVPDLDTVYVPVGCGSGLCATIAARDALGLKTKVVGVVSAHVDAAKRSFEAGQLLTSLTAYTFADGVAVCTPVQAALDYFGPRADRFVGVADDEVADAIRIYWQDTHNLAEGAGAVALAALIQEKEQMRGKKVAVILSGGNGDMSQMAQILGGDLSVVSEPQKGTQFTVRLMLGHVAGQSADSQPIETIRGYEGQRRRILLIDDDAATLDVMTGAFERRGIEVVPCADPQQVEQALQGELEVGAIVTDLRMPGLDGFEVLRRAGMVTVKVRREPVRDLGKRDVLASEFLLECAEHAPPAQVHEKPRSAYAQHPEVGGAVADVDDRERRSHGGTITPHGGAVRAYLPSVTSIRCSERSGGCPATVTSSCTMYAPLASVEISSSIARGDMRAPRTEMSSTETRTGVEAGDTPSASAMRRKKPTWSASGISRMTISDTWTFSPAGSVLYASQ